MKVEGEFNITPALLADAFWNMDDNQQAEFFAELYKLTSKQYKNKTKQQWHILDEYGSSQWCSMAATTKKHSKEAYRMYLRFCAFAFDFYPQKYDW
jgi:hypothetical protein